MITTFTREHIRLDKMRRAAIQLGDLEAAHGWHTMMTNNLLDAAMFGIYLKDIAEAAERVGYKMV